jgi:arylsulfatase A-like enzyme/tetratricopeptide (TPR) repeat protein
MLSLTLVLAFAGPPNVVVVTIDTLRADYLHVYGHATIETPTTDRLAREGVLVEDATVQAPQTRPSHTSFFTGRYPWEHGVRDNFSPPLREDMPTMASILHGRGYKTAAFIGSYVLASRAGLDRGFDLYDEPFSAARRGSSESKHPERPAWEVVERTLDWLRRAGPGPFFVWVHLYDPHAPYTPPPAYAKKYADQPYEGEVSYADAQVGRLVDFLDAQKLRRRTLFVVTSDHGEGLGDHGENEHLFFLYDSTLRVPLILSQPGVLPMGKRIQGQFRSVDLLPSVLALLGAPAVASSGASRAQELRSGSRLPDNESPSETLFGALHFGYAPVRALRGEGWKFIDVPRPELYDLRKDPREETNLIQTRAPVVSAMLDHLRRYDTGSRGTATPPPLKADASVLEKMAALGYIGGPVPLAGSASGADPKEKIREYQNFRDDGIEAQSLFSAGRLDEALAIFDRLAKVGLASFDQQHVRGSILLRKGRYEEAIKSFEIALRMVPHFDQLYVDIAQAYVELGRHEEARRTIERGLKIEPANSLLLTAKGGLLQRLGDLQGARSVLEAARTADPAEASVRVQLGEVLLALGDNEGALKELQAATRLRPSSVQAFTEYGVALMAAGRKREAAAAFRLALKKDPFAGDALIGLARLQLTDDPDAALTLLQRLVSHDPGFPGVGGALKAAREAKAAAAPRFKVITVADRAQAEEIARALTGGAVPPSSAAATSDVSLDSVDEPARSAAARLAPGQISDVVETASGFVVVKRER